MLEGSIVDFAHKGPFALYEANSLVAILNRITKRHGEKVNTLIAQLEKLPDSDLVRSTEIENVISKEIEAWNAKVRKLGATPKGMWMADIDSGDGFFCWKFPESEVKFWHDYKSGFANRIPLANVNLAENKLKNFGEVKNSDIY